jgi:hypothetical protein
MHHEEEVHLPEARKLPCLPLGDKNGCRIVARSGDLPCRAGGGRAVRWRLRSFPQLRADATGRGHTASSLSAFVGPGSWNDARRSPTGRAGRIVLGDVRPRWRCSNGCFGRDGCSCDSLDPLSGESPVGSRACLSGPSGAPKEGDPRTDGLQVGGSARLWVSNLHRYSGLLRLRGGGHGAVSGARRNPPLRDIRNCAGHHNCHLCDGPSAVLRGRRCWRPWCRAGADSSDPTCCTRRTINCPDPSLEAHGGKEAETNT